MGVTPPRKRLHGVHHGLSHLPPVPPQPNGGASGHHRLVYPVLRVHTCRHFEIKGLQELEVCHRCVVMANHQSVLDVMGLMEGLPKCGVQMAKWELVFMGPAGLIMSCGTPGPL